jgi:hypothetical protein
MRNVVALTRIKLNLFSDLIGINMQVLFPNPYGFKLPQKNHIPALQKLYGFSNDYAEFLRLQNGFLFDKLEESVGNKKYLSASLDDAEHCSDLRVLYGFESGDDYYDLLDNLENLIMFQSVFFPIGVGYGGNDYVEILAGEFKGFIASLDHEMYASSSSIEDFVDEMNLKGFHDFSVDEKADVLVDEQLGLVWLHAISMAEFTECCIRCDQQFRGFVSDAASLDRVDNN